MKLLRRLPEIWVDRPSIDYPLTLALAVAVAVWNPRSTVRPADQAAWYQTLSAASAALLLIGAIMITLVFTVAPNERMERVLDDVGQGLRGLAVRCLGGLLVTTAGFAGMFLLEQYVARPVRIGAVVALISFAGLRATRLWWLLARILKVLMLRRSDPPAVRKPPQEAWAEPVIGPEDYPLAARRPPHRPAATRRQ